MSKINNTQDMADIIANISKIEELKKRRREQEATKARQLERLHEARKERRKKETKAEAEGWDWLLMSYDEWEADWIERQNERNINK